MTEVTPQTQMMDMMRAMNETMAKQQELFMKLLEDRDANHLRHETIEENGIIAGSGGTEGDIRTDELATLETKQPEKGCSYKSSDCEERQKVKYGSQLLRGTTLTWWNVFTSTIEESVLARMSWAEFKKKILEEYCTEEELDSIEEEFRSIKKGDLSVKGYTRLFMEKIDLVGHVAPTDKDKVKAYLKGLPADMITVVHNSKASNLCETMEEAKVTERLFAQDKAEKTKTVERRGEEKRRWESPPSSYKNSRFQPPSKSFDNRREAKWFPKCKSKHFGFCKTNSNPTLNPVSCFKCGQPSHLSVACPIRGTICFECKEIGHVRKECPKLRGVARGGSSGSQSKREAIPKA
ncbi:hypothetical protein L6452_02904 [Arctium lappa]|uniref:Uncharacterized protein n=1 Tax=Arctium lappa TaxID=4217 RepID=A0ACB9FKP9_ARCLA|nr:hypothetical protein L6452_02904 [Arctium lappa]